MARSVGAANTPPTADKATRKGEKETMMMMMMMMMMDKSMCDSMYYVKYVGH
jgi:hypothetical protein